MRSASCTAPRASSLLERTRGARPDAALPPEISFLGDIVDPALLVAAARTARLENTCAARALLAYRGLHASTYYRALAKHLGLSFVDGWPRIARDTDVAAALRRGRVRLADVHAVRWLIAPQDDVLRALLTERLPARGRKTLAIATPAHLAALVNYHGQSAIEHAASEALPSQAPDLSAKGAVSTNVRLAVVVATLCLGVGLLEAPRLVSCVFGVLFFSSICLRLVLSASGPEPRRPTERRIPDGRLPSYTILVALHREAEVLPDLLAALEALDYPRTKLEVLILIEPEDLATRSALAKADLPPWLQVVFGPRGGPLRTKPRALNIGLLMARGELLTVYDAEDRPDPQQLRHAAAFFAAAPRDLGCVQARLAIDNGAGSLLARLFAIEYAALFDVLNVGTARYRLPLALGGTSNHFRTAVLRGAGGWDAWNVTEDADLGLRLARLSVRIACLDSTTWEAAPERLGIWMRQRRRWTKGWMQTFLVVTRDAPKTFRQLGWKKFGALTLLLVNLVVGPLVFPLFSCFVGYHLIVAGIPAPRGVGEIIEATLETSVIALGIGSTLWCGYRGMRTRGLMGFLPSLALLPPYQLMISLAAWLGAIDLVRRPYHWHKTTHAASTTKVDRGTQETPEI